MRLDARGGDRGRGRGAARPPGTPTSASATSCAARSTSGSRTRPSASATSRFFGQRAGTDPSSPLAAEQPFVQLVGGRRLDRRGRPTSRAGIPVDATRPCRRGRASRASTSGTRRCAASTCGSITLPAAPGVAVQLTRSLAEVDRNLADLRLRLILAGLGGVALAAALGLLVARSALRPGAAADRRGRARGRDPGPLGFDRRARAGRGRPARRRASTRCSTR